MKIQLIRNAMIKITCGGVTFLVDPWLAEKGAWAPSASFGQRAWISAPSWKSSGISPCPCAPCRSSGRPSSPAWTRTS